MFAAANQGAAHGHCGPISQIAQATRDAHALIVNHRLSHVDQNRWIHFDNVAEWGTAYLDRAALNEYIQYGNNAAAPSTTTRSSTTPEPRWMAALSATIS